MKLQKGAVFFARHLTLTRVYTRSTTQYTRTLKNNAQTISRKLKKLPKYRTFAYMAELVVLYRPSTSSRADG
jgi:hypothetical protein